MATATASTPATDSPAQPRGGSARRGGDRGRGRGRGRGGQGGRGDGRAGPRSGGQRKGADGQQSTDRPVQAPEVNRQTTLQVGPAPPIVPVTPDADDAASNNSADICFICADPVQYSAIAPCNHVTCHICALRLRALYKSKSCAHCRTESDYVIFTKDANKRFEEFTDSDIVARNDALGIKYEDQAICDDTTLLLRYNCPDANCDRACRGWPDLHRHVRQDHGMVMCDLCTRHKKVFTHEHTLFTKAQLHKHERKGDDNPGSETQSGFKGHPECRFCSKRFYSNDELYEHCRHNHERCFICDRRNVGQQPSYYIDYPALERHFKNSHFMCHDRECLEKKFVVFEHEVDLKAHILEAHPSGLSKSERRDARRVDMSTFQDARPAYQPRGSRGHGNQNYVSREGEREQPRAVQSAQSLTSRTFGGQLTTEDFPLPGASTSASTPQAAQAPAIRPPAQPPAPVSRPPDAFPPLGGSTPRTAARIVAPSAPSRRQTAAEAFPPLGGSSRTTTTPPNGRSSSQPSGSEPARPAARPSMTDEVRRLKHTAVIERASNLLRNEQQKIDTFRSYVSKFRAGAFSGEELVEAFWALMDVSPADMGKLMNELIEIYEDERKQSELRRAWNNWKAINEDYPPIAGISSSSTLTTLTPTTTASSNRVLRLKSSTKKSSRSSTARQTAWGTASHSYPLSDSTSRRSPPLPSSSSSSSAPQQFSSTTSYAKANGKQKAAAVARRDEFPGLPQVNRKPANWTPVQAKKSSWEPNPPEVNPWAAGGSSEGQQQGQGQAEGEQTGGRKKKGKGKEVLFRVGL